MRHFVPLTTTSIVVDQKILILPARMISVIKQQKTLKAMDNYNSGIFKMKAQEQSIFRLKSKRKQRLKRKWCWFYEIPFQLLLTLMLKVFSVGLMSNATIAAEPLQTETSVGITLTAASVINDDIKAYNEEAIETKTAGISAIKSETKTDAAAVSNFALNTNKTNQIVAVATNTTTTTKTTTTTTTINITSHNIIAARTYIKLNNMWTNITRSKNKNKNSKKKRSSYKNTLATQKPTAAFMTSTIAITTSPTANVTIELEAYYQQHHQHQRRQHRLNTAQQEIFQNSNAKTTATTTTTTPTIRITSASTLMTSLITNSIYTDLIEFASVSSSPSTPNAAAAVPSFPLPFPLPSSSSPFSSSSTISPPNLNISFHQYCLASRGSFADLVTIVLYSAVCIVGLFGNTLVIYVVLRFSKMQTVTNIYILNLAIADECFLIGIPFLLYTMRICSWTFGEYMCKAYMVSTSITQFTSSIFLLIMSADRFIAVCHPIASPRYRTIYIAKMVSALAWLTSVVLMLPVILFANTITQEDGLHYSCNIDWPELYKKHSGTTFILYTFFLGFATPLCFILCFYYLVIKKLHAVGRKHKSKEKKRSHRKVTRLVLTVITVYILCWLPHWISQVALISSNPDQSDLSSFEILIFLLLGCLAYSNSAMNPILYAFLSDNFRKSFSKAFTCMAGHEVNAQLQVEPSVFTNKHGGSRRRNSKRRNSHATVKTKATLHANPAIGNNNSSTTTSSTTTQNEKNTIGTACGGKVPVSTTTLTTSTGNSTATSQLGDIIEQSIYATANGRISAENVMLILDKQETVCSAVLERSSSTHFIGGNTLQTDL